MAAGFWRPCLDSNACANTNQFKRTTVCDVPYKLQSATTHRVLVIRGAVGCTVAEEGPEGTPQSAWNTDDSMDWLPAVGCLQRMCTSARRRLLTQGQRHMPGPVLLECNHSGARASLRGVTVVPTCSIALIGIDHGKAGQGGQQHETGKHGACKSAGWDDR